MLNRIWLICAIATLAPLVAHAQHDLPHINPTGKPYTIVVTAASVDGQPLRHGDIVAVYDGDMLVGRASYHDELPLMLTAWEGDAERGLDGFVRGRPMTLSVYTERYGSWQLLSANLELSTGDGTFGYGSFSVLGLSASTSARPSLDLSPIQLDFGSVPIGEEGNVEITLHNRGDAPLQVFDIHSSQWHFWPDRHSVQLQPGASASVRVTFSPSEALPAAGELTFLTDDPLNPRIIVTLQGQGLPPRTPVIIAEPKRIDFGSVRSGETGVQTLRLWNRGNDTLSIVSIRSNSPAITLDHDLQATPPGGWLDVKVGFNATDTGLHDAQITIQSNSTNDPYSYVDVRAVTHSGHFQRPVDTGLHYPVVLTSVTVDNQPLEPGDEIALLAGDLVVGHGAYDGTLPFTLNANKADPARNLVGFGTDDPIRIAVHTRRYNQYVEVVLDDFNSETGTGNYGHGAYAALSADGRSGLSPVAAVDYGAIRFDGTTVNQESEEITRYVNNTGSSTLTAEVAVSGEFYVRPGGPRSIAPGDSLAYHLRFAPTEHGIVQGEVHWYTTDPYRSHITVPIVGRGLPQVPQERLLISAPEWIDAQVGGSATAEIEVKNLFATQEEISVGIDGEGGRVSLSHENLFLGPNGTARITLTFSPIQVGRDDVLLSFRLGDGRELTRPMNLLGYEPLLGAVTPTGNSYHLVIEDLLAPGAPFEPGDVIGVFDGDVLVGVHYVRDSTSGISIPLWRRDESRGLPGFRDGEPITLRFFKSVLGYEGKHVLEPFSIDFSNAGRFGEGSYQSVRAVVREPIYFRSPGRTIAYERDEFTTRTLAHVDSLVHVPNRQSVTHTFLTDSEGLTISQVGNFVRLRLEEGFTGPVTFVHTVTDGVEILTDTTWFDIVPPPLVDIPVVANEGWNLIGPSVETEASISPYELFDNAIGGTAFQFDGAYSDTDIIESGRGYWVRFSQADTSVVSGRTLRKHEIPLQQGWNLISGISSPVSVSDILDPSRVIIAGTVYEYGGAYRTSDSILPGRGYWIRTSRAGTVTLAESSSKAASLAASEASEQHALHALTISHGELSEVKLFFGGAGPDGAPDPFLPPRPPAGAFDARFSDDTWLSPADSVVVLLQSGGKPISVRLASDASQCVVRSYDGTRIVAEEMLAAGDEITLVAGVDRLEVINRSRSTGVLQHQPTSWHVGENYPNPFADATSIPIHVPESTHVMLKVYDVLGRQVATLWDGIMTPGRHVVEFRSNDLGPGVYFYHLESSGRIHTGRMMVVR